MTDLEQCCCTQSLKDQLNACMAQQTMNLQTQMLINSIRPFAPPAYSGVNPMYNPFNTAFPFGFGCIFATPEKRKVSEEEKEKRRDRILLIKNKTLEASECIEEYHEFCIKLREIKNIIDEDNGVNDEETRERVRKKFLHWLRISGAILTALLALFILVFFIVSVSNVRIVRAWLSFPWFFISGAASLWLFAKSSEDKL